MFRFINKNSNKYDLLSEYKKSDGSKSFEQKYNITINDDGSIYDPITKSNHSCLMTWMNSLTF